MCYVLEAVDGGLCLLSVLTEVMHCVLGTLVRGRVEPWTPPSWKWSPVCGGRSMYEV